VVIFVYGYKIKPIKDGQFCIPYLAVVDLMGAVICSLVGLSMTLMPVMYDLAILCKTGWLLATIATIMSVFMLVIIAIQCYIKVCTQKAHIVTLKWKRSFMGFILYPYTNITTLELKGIGHHQGMKMYHSTNHER
jgi:hypothetical protein